MVQAILFDLDGTLTNTLQDIAVAMNRALRLHGLREHPVDAYRYMVGNGAKKLAERAVGDHPEMRVAVQAEYQAYYERHTRVHTKPYDGIPPLLEALQARGLKLCVLSNKPHADTVQVVQSFFPQIRWAVIRGQVEGVPVKPDPAGALAILRELALRPDECLYLGDTAVDMQTACGAGIDAVGVLWGFRERQELEEHGAKWLIEQPEQLLDVLEQQQK